MSLLFWRKTHDTDIVGSTPSQAVSEDTPLPVRLYPGDDEDAQAVSFERLLPASPSSYNVTLTSADTEYSQELPTGCRRFEFQCRTEASMRWAYTTSHVASSVAPFHTLKAGGVKDSGLLAREASPIKLYLASGTAGVIVEIEAWA